jgi:uncharacterized damage-inducible protein DinB
LLSDEPLKPETTRKSIPSKRVQAYAKLKRFAKCREQNISGKERMPESESAESAGEPCFTQLPQALLNAFDTNNRISVYLIENLPAEAWRAKPPGGKGRTIAAIVAHMHNVRVMWLKTAKAEDIPEQLERETVTPARAVRALGTSCAALEKLCRQAVEKDGRIKGFRPDVAGFVGYLIAHDAHHRGQIAMLARQLGHPLPQKAMFGMWEWGSRGSG